MRSLNGVGARIERLARQQDGQSVGAVVAAILDGRHPGPRLSDEELARSPTGRLLLARRQRAARGFQD
jgi:hypothetical protein